MALQTHRIGEERLQTLVARYGAWECRLTPQRLSVLRLMPDGGHLPAEKAYRPLRATSSTTRLATVCKTVDVLKRAGEPLEIQVPTRSNRYDVAAPMAHPRDTCTRCGAVSDLEGLDADAVARLRELAPGLVIDWRLNLLGQCAACRSVTTQKAPDG